jgi:hypothetical protein
MNIKNCPCGETLFETVFESKHLDDIDGKSSLAYHLDDLGSSGCHRSDKCEIEILDGLSPQFSLVGCRVTTHSQRSILNLGKKIRIRNMALDDGDVLLRLVPPFLALNISNVLESLAQTKTPRHLLRIVDDMGFVDQAQLQANWQL